VVDERPLSAPADVDVETFSDPDLEAVVDGDSHGNGGRYRASKARTSFHQAVDEEEPPISGHEIR
jgi:hypothetical protein